MRDEFFDEFRVQAYPEVAVSVVSAVAPVLTDAGGDFDAALREFLSGYAEYLEGVSTDDMQEYEVLIAHASKNMEVQKNAG